MTILKSKIADYLADVTKSRKDIFFNFGQTTASGIIGAYFIEIYDMASGTMERRLYFSAKIVENDNVEEVKKAIEPILAKKPVNLKGEEND